MTDKKEEFEFSAVIASAVHDMKNSLFMLLNEIDEVMGNCDPENCPSYLKFMQLKYEGNRVNHNLMQLLTMYRMNQAEYSLNINEHDIEECVEELFLECFGLMNMKGVEIEQECEDGLLWYFDRNIIMGLLSSVINNVYKYTKSRVKISARSENDYLVIRIDDDGQGFPESMLHEDKDHTPDISYKSGSTGLGLYFASHIAGLHENKGRKGFITTTNDGIDGGGSFSIYLP